MDRSNSVPTAVTFLIVIALVVGAVFLVKNAVDNDQEKLLEEAIKEIGELPNINVSIGGESYTAITQVSYASQNFISNIPVSIEMKDEGSNKKQGCTYFKFSGDTVRAKEVKRGDILLYGDSCIVIATADFKGGSKYKKIGHINNMGDLPSGTQTVSFSPIK